MEVKVINRSKHSLPKYETKASAGLDLRSNLEESVTLPPLGRKLIPTGLFMEIPDGMEAQVRPRSGLALKNGVTVLNSPGTIDSDYRGEIGVLLINLSNIPFEIKDGERIAQLIFSEVKQVQLDEVSSIGSTSRGAGGFGSTGVK